jgi:hypothetical protein
MIWRFTFEQTPIHATRILTAICQFLQTYPLDPVPAPDSQPYTDSNQRVETVLMTDPRAQPTKPTVACFFGIQTNLEATHHLLQHGNAININKRVHLRKANLRRSTLHGTPSKRDFADSS